MESKTMSRVDRELRDVSKQFLLRELDERLNLLVVFVSYYELADALHKMGLHTAEFGL